MDDLIRTLGEHLQESEGCQAYILIDPMLREPFEPELLEAAGCRVYRIPVQRLEHEPDKWPRLYSWHPTAAHVLAATVKASLDEQSDPVRESRNGFAFGGWLLSTAPTNELVAHFRRVMQLRQPGGGPRYFRWFDRRVLEWLWGVLSTDQQDQLLGPITAWWSLDRRGALVERKSSATGDTKVQPFALTVEQWAHAHNGEVVQAMLRGWQRFSEELPADYLERATEAVIAAQALGLQRQQDILLLGAYALQVHPRICEHPTIRQAVAQAAQQDGALGRALADIPDPSGWDEIRQDLENTSKYRLAG